MRSRTSAVIVLALVILVTLAAHAQQARKVYRIGTLELGAGPTPLFNNAFLGGLRDLGYIEGQNIIFERRYAAGKLELLPELATELVRLKPDVIVARPIRPAQAVRQATSTIPIVVVSCDPFQLIVESLARPGRNVTGLTCMSAELSAKKLELLKEAVPTVSRVAFLYNPNEPGPVLALNLTRAAAERLGVSLHAVEVRVPGDFEAAYAAILRERANGLFIYHDTLTASQRQGIVEFAAKNRLPAMYGFKEWVDAGGLMSYGTDNPGMFRRAATYVDKILRGAKPADLPVEQPTKFDLIINLKTAKTLGLTIPQSIFIRADHVIQ